VAWLLAATAGGQCIERDAVADRWTPYFEEGVWCGHDGVLESTGDAALSGRVVDAPDADVAVEVEACVGDSERRNLGIVLRARENGVCVVARYYDRLDCLEIIPYAGERHGEITRSEPGIGIAPDAWCRMKAAAVGDLVLVKCWPADTPEPEAWQVRARYASRRPGSAGVHVHDGTRASFRNVRVCWGGELDALRASLAAEEAAKQQRARDTLRLAVDVTPFVMRAPDAPKRRIRFQPISDADAVPVSGRLSVAFGDMHVDLTIEAEESAMGPLTLYIPEPDTPKELEATFHSDDGTALVERVTVAPARRWTFYMTPHTHYDIGYTDPQPAVINRLVEEMNDAVRFCEETVDWPEDSRYRWTVEVSALMKEYLARRPAEETARFLGLAREGRIEICGFYLNMPTELVGHEELIRCLYFADELRRNHDVPINTVMIDDVPGYAWALPQVLAEAGMGRVSLRANSIRGQFLWHRPGAVPRPFYWEGPEGSRVFVWYTDSYREGNFFREPGLHEEEFLKIIRRNEEAGAWVDLIQLRMGGDNLPPDLDASRNARKWNEQYLWPRVVVATNREFLDALEALYHAQAETHRGDIPSWWADGPASSAHETGRNRLVHDRLVAAEALHTLRWLADTRVAYPFECFARAYDAMIHFDEHTWGAAKSVSEPDSPDTRAQWDWKAQQGRDAAALTNGLLGEAVEAISARVPKPQGRGIVVWNTLGWPRDDIVELDLAHAPFEGDVTVAVDLRTGAESPVQVSRDGKRAWFIARNVPALGYAVYEFRRDRDTGLPAIAQGAVIEDDFHRIMFDPQTGAWRSWFSKELNRELFDADAPYHANQPIHEQPIGGRDAVNAKQPVSFERAAAEEGERVALERGEVFSEFTRRTALPHCPEIIQRVRLYHGLPWIDIENIVRKEANTAPENVYFAFPFDVPDPEFHLQIANATMRPGADQLPYSCFDFYSIQQWATVAGKDFGVVFAPLEAPVVTLSDLNVYRWTDSLTFDKAHVYSLVMNNCWHTNFKADQEGEIRFRYRLAAYGGAHDAVRATHTAWPAFQPLIAASLEPGSPPETPLPDSFLTIEGDPVIVSCVKAAESGEGFIVRLLEMNGAPAKITIRFNLPGGRPIASAHVATVIETPTETLPVADDAVNVTVRPRSAHTLLIIPGAN